MTVQRPASKLQSPASYIQEFGAMNVFTYDNQDNNQIEQKLQEDERTQQENVIIHRDKTKAELV